jgi:ligand-binding sensor domain-containing protein
MSLGITQWSNIGLPYGYNYNTSYIDQEGNMFIGTTESIYYSDDHGQSWVITSSMQKFKNINGLDKIIELENQDLLLNSGNDIYKFNKSTKTWDLFFIGKYQLRNIDTQGKVWYENNDPNNPGIYLTKDGGNSYQFITFNDPQAQ